MKTLAVKMFYWNHADLQLREFSSMLHKSARQRGMSLYHIITYTIISILMTTVHTTSWLQADDIPLRCSQVWEHTGVHLPPLTCHPPRTGWRHWRGNCLGTSFWLVHCGRWARMTQVVISARRRSGTETIETCRHAGCTISPTHVPTFILHITANRHMHNCAVM